MSNPALTLRRQGLIFALFALGLSVLALPFIRPAEVPSFFLFIGRLHPLILHFPIVLIILALLFEVAGTYYRVRVGENTMTVILVIAAVSALISIAAGFFLFASGDYSGNLIELHFWAGALTGAFTFFTLGLFLLHRATTRFYYLYFGALLITNATVGYTSHLGGSITHGQDYLTEHLEFLFYDIGQEKTRPRSEMLVYEDMIAPIFEAKCMSCHNDQRARAGLRLTSYQGLLRGGESGHPSVTAGKPGGSELYSRVVLPEGHKDRMPPEGKTPLTESEIRILKFWISSGATDTLRVANAEKVDTIRDVIAHLLPKLVKYRRRAHIEKIKRKSLEAELEEVATKLDITIRPDSLSDDGLFAIGMKFPPAPFTNDQFRELSPYFQVFSKVSLTSSGIDDAGLYYIGQMENLRELYLQKTGVDGSGIVYLQKLPRLEVLNLSFTKTDDKAAIDLLNFPALREVYLYRTKTSMQMIEALRKYKPGVRFLLEEGPYF